jgi:hypothetical protein
VQALEDEGDRVSLDAVHTPLGLGARRPLPAREHNLRAQVNSFIGRERDLEEAKRLLAGTRLLTVTGPGGIGKTRLALQVANDVVADYEHGVWLVELAPFADSALVSTEVAVALAIRAAVRCRADTVRSRVRVRGWLDSGGCRSHSG